MARIPHSGRSAIVLVATVSLLVSLVNWAISTILTALLVIALAKRKELNMDYRAAAAAAIIGMGATWALGISSSAAQLQANKASLPESIYNLTGVIPFTETIFVAIFSHDTGTGDCFDRDCLLVGAKGQNVKTMQDFQLDFDEDEQVEEKSNRPGDWLENSPILTILVVVLGLIWMALEFSKTIRLLPFPA